MKKKFYFYARNRGRRVTVAGVVTGENELTIATAECMTVDNFSKAEGRKYAEARIAGTLPLNKTSLIKRSLNGELTNKTAAQVLIDAVKNDLKLKPWKREWPTEEVKNVL
jgi:hypothetical protein